MGRDRGERAARPGDLGFLLSSLRDEVLSEGLRGLSRRLRAGHPVDPSALDDSEYRGVSLGLPRFVERLTWKTFQKTFHRDPATGALRGWNVRVEQRGVDARSVPLTKGGEPVTVWHYVVIDPAGQHVPRGCDRGLLLHYGLGRNPPREGVDRVRDPLVALVPGSVELLLGWTYLRVAGMNLPSPSFFLLEREGPLSRVVPPPLVG